MGEGRNILFMRHEDDRVAGFVQTREQLHDFLAGSRVEGARGLVGEDDGRMVAQGPRDGDSLTLSTRQFVRTVIHAVTEADGIEGLLGALTPFAAGQTGVDQGQFHIAQGISTG